MKIKTTKKMRLDELLKHVWHEGGEHKTYMSNEGKSVGIDDSGIQFLSDYKINSGIVLSRETFTVEVEEELTEETVIRGLADVFFDPLVNGPNVEYHTDCIKNIKQDGMETHSLAIFYKDTLVWSREHGIPESGVLEVDNDENQDS